MQKQYRPLCFQSMRQDAMDKNKWYCHIKHYNGKAVLIDLSKSDIEPGIVESFDIEPDSILNIEHDDRGDN